MSGSVSFFPSFKICTKCGELKALTEFDASRRDGRVAACKPCRLQIKKRRDLGSPRVALRISLHSALRRRPTTNPVSIDGLLVLWGEQRGKCAVSGVEMTWSGKLGDVREHKGHVAWNSLTLDRIDQRQGYEPGNVRLVCFAVNAFRGSMTDNQMMELARGILARCPP